MNIRWKKTASYLLITAMLLSGAADHAQAATPKQKISKKKLTLSIGAAKKLTITNTKGCLVTWKSSQSKVASVTKKGKVVAKRVGSTQIKAVIKNRKTKKKKVLMCRVTVTGENKPTEAAVSHNPSAAPPTSSAIAPSAPSASSVPTETAQTPLPTPSDTSPTDPPIKTECPSGTATAGAIDFRGRCQYIGASGGGAGPQGYVIYNTGDLEKIFGEDGELGKKDGPIFFGRDIQPEPDSDEYYQWIRPVTEPVMAQYDEAYFQDKMLYCILFREGALNYDIHITDVCLAKNERGKEELTLFTKRDDDKIHSTAEGVYMILLELNPSDFERAESTRLDDLYVENHRVSDMGSLEMDRLSGVATEG